MKAQSLQLGKLSDSMVLAVVCISTVYWLLDSILNIFFSNKFNLIAQLFGPDLYDIYIRVVVLCLLVILGSHAQSIINRLNEAKQKLNESEELWRSLVETAPDTIMTLDQSGVIRFINHPLAEMPAGRVTGRSLYDLLPSDYRETAEEIVRSVFQTGQTDMFEVLMKDDRNPAWYTFRVGPLRLDRRVIAKRGSDTFLKMVLEHGFFHGDPHPGNVLIMPGNVICLLDYGIVGRLDAQMKGYLTDILLAILKRDIDEVISLLAYSGEIGENLNIRALKRDLSEFIDSYYEIPLQEIEVGRILVEFIDIITTYHIKLQPDLMLLAKALVIIEGMGRELDPHFDMVDHLRPFMEKAIQEKMSPGHIARDMGAIFMSYVNLTKNLPRELRDILHRINRNKFKIDLEHRGLDQFSKEMDKSINRLSSSLIIAALIIGSSIIMQTDKGPLILDFPAFAFLGYTIAGMIGLWWVIAIIRSGRL